jgi:ATP-dependent DNA helicase RecG
VSQPEVDDLLRRVLDLERSQGYKNRAMQGGISAFSRALHGRASAQSILPQVALILASYDQEEMPTRQAAISEALTLLDAQTPLSDGHADAPTGDPSGFPVGGASPVAPPSSEDHIRGVGHAESAGGVVEVPPDDPVVPAVPTRARRTRAARSATRGGAEAVSLDAATVTFPGIGPKLAETLAGAGVHTLRDLLRYFPREHLDYRRRDRIRTLRYGERTTIVATVESVRTRHIRAKLTVTTAVVADDSGRIQISWFNQPYLERELRTGRRLAISGEPDLFHGRLVFVPRDFEWIEDRELTHAARLVPIYPLHRGLYQKSLRGLMRRAVAALARRVEEFLPAHILSEAQLVSEAEAFEGYHFPDSDDELAASRHRLAFDEIFSIQVGLLLRKREWQTAGLAPILETSAEEKVTFFERLHFAPTRAQERVISEVEQSLRSTRPMSRLVQGDVGAGKTVIAAFALYTASVRGYQSAIMAPTEILALQHVNSLRTWLGALGIRVELLTGSTRAADRRAVLAGLETGAIDVLVGTHSLFQESVDFAKLGVAVVDEQHRFGVDQRSRLRRKGVSPHLLAMTATPIPRTLQLTAYGDLDISVLDELPPGRVPIETILTSSPGRAQRMIADEVEAGRQAFVVCPLIDDSSEADTKSAIAEQKRLQNEVFPRLKVGLLHGRLTSKEKDRVLLAFRDGEYNILVATTVIEVGIDIPNATVMVIRDAHRFGLAQLHQLRGRIGRGGERSYCVLMSQAEGGPAVERLRAVVESQDGFALAEEDLRLRGPGEFWGTRQSGIPALRVAGPSDVGMMREVRAIAAAMLDQDPDLSAEMHAGVRAAVDSFWAREAELH